MAADSELEAIQLAQIEADLAELAAHVDSWINDRFLSSDSAAHLSIEDVAIATFTQMAAALPKEQPG